MKNLIALIKQMIRFGLVGFLCFFIDWGVMSFLTEIFSVYYLLSSVISYSVSTIVNYILSVTVVFETEKKRNRGKEFIVFVFLSLIGLGINSLCMKIGVDFFHIHYMVTKIGATAVVMVYNFITRKIFIEKKS